MPYSTVLYCTYRGGVHSIADFNHRMPQHCKGCLLLAVTSPCRLSMVRFPAASADVQLQLFPLL